jgi:hypothetical protein
MAFKHRKWPVALPLWAKDPFKTSKLARRIPKLLSHNQLLQFGAIFTENSFKTILIICGFTELFCKKL